MRKLKYDFRVGNIDGALDLVTFYTNIVKTPYWKTDWYFNVDLEELGFYEEWERPAAFACDWVQNAIEVTIPSDHATPGVGTQNFSGMVDCDVFDTIEIEDFNELVALFPWMEYRTDEDRARTQIHDDQGTLALD